MASVTHHINLVAGFVFIVLPALSYQVSLTICPGKTTLPSQVQIPVNYSLVRNHSAVFQPLTFKLEPSIEGGCDSDVEVKLNYTIQSNESHWRSRRFTSEGYFLHNKSFISPDEYCVNEADESSISLRLCSYSGTEEECSRTKPCVKKCCGLDEVLDLSGSSIRCRPSGLRKWKPALYLNEKERVNEDQLQNTTFQYIQHHPKQFCTNSSGSLIYALKSIPNTAIVPFRVLENGSVTVKVSRNKWKIHPHTSYCVDGVQNFRTQVDDAEDISGGTQEVPLSGLYSGLDEDSVLLDCRSYERTSEVQATQTLQNSIYASALLIAIFFLILTIAAHLVTWRKQNIHSWTLMGYVVSLLAQFMLLLMSRIAVNEVGSVCTAVGICLHFATLSTFAWLSVMNFDVWLTLRTLNPSGLKMLQVRRFIGYFVFAVSLPLTIVSVGLILQKKYGDDAFSDVIVPAYGELSCSLGRDAGLPYLYGPMAFLLSTNFIFLFATIYSIYRNNKFLKTNGVSNKQLSDKVRLFSMLFVVAGVTWIFEVASWATIEYNASTPWYWVVFDLVNIFQSVGIFIIFVCNPSMVYCLKEDYPQLTRLFCCKHKSDERKNNNGDHTQVFSMQE